MYFQIKKLSGMSQISFPQTNSQSCAINANFILLFIKQAIIKLALNYLHFYFNFYFQHKLKVQSPRPGLGGGPGCTAWPAAPCPWPGCRRGAPPRPPPAGRCSRTWARGPATPRVSAPAAAARSRGSGAAPPPPCSQSEASSAARRPITAHLTSTRRSWLVRAASAVMSSSLASPLSTLSSLAR